LGTGGWSTLSDKRIKSNIKENVPGLAFISLLHPVTYNLDIHKQMELRGKEAKQTADWDGKYDIEKSLCQDSLPRMFEAAAKSIGYDFSGVDVPKNPNDLYSLKYADFVVPLVKAVQEQQQLIQDQQKIINDLIKRVEKLEHKYPLISTS